MEIPSTFDINKRFTFLSKLTTMVANKKTQSLVVTGEGGLGKTYTVTNTIEKLGLEENQYHIIKGYSTPRGLYNTLYDNNGKLIIFDDCDSVLEHTTSLNILKGALDSYDKRLITWSAKMSKGDEYPQQFEFTGQIIFISNKNREKINQAIISRSMVVDLAMSDDDKIARMKYILPYICRPMLPSIKVDAMSLIEKNKEDIKDLNIRTLIKVCKIREAFEGDGWEELAKYTILEG